MNRTAYRRLARTIMNEHGLQGWTIIWSRAKRTHGRCYFGRRALEFSEVAFDHIGEDEVRDTILHEVAHALAGHAAGHGPAWKRIHRQIGGTGGQYVSTAAREAIPTAWEGRCPVCDTVTSKQHRAPLRVKACGRHGRVYRPELILVWSKNGRRVHLTDMPVRYISEVRGLVIKYGDRVKV